jgi:hypothetical protein
MTREGSNISLELHVNDRFRVLGLYPRRPKSVSAKDERLVIKINEQILIGAQVGSKVGIPIIGGCPIASDFWELGNDPNCLWVNLESQGSEDYEIQLDLSNSPYQIKTHSEFVFHSDRDLLDYVEMKSKAIDINTALDAFKSIKMHSSGYGNYYHMAFMGGYKPVYFLMR